MIERRGPASSRRGAPDDQVRIAELVPKISMLARLSIGALEIALTSAGCVDNAAEDRQMRSVRLVKPCNQPIDGSEWPFVVDNEAGPPFSRAGPAALVGDGFECANDGRAHGDDAMSVATGAVDTLRRRKRDTIELLVRRLMIFETRHTGVQDQRRDLDAG